MQKTTLPALCVLLSSCLVFCGCAGMTGAPPASSATTSSSTSNSPQPSSVNSFNDIQAGAGWNGYALLPPGYSICESCTPSGDKASWSTEQKISSPSISGQAMRFDLGSGSMPFSDILWNVKFTKSLKDQKSVPQYHKFTYEVYFYGEDLEKSQALEFDINQFFDKMSFIWGHECRISAGHEWDTWNNQTKHWIKSGIPCNPKSNAWNHLVIQVERTADNHLRFDSITLNGLTSQVNRDDLPTATTWYGMTINYQMDGNRNQEPYSVYLDKLKFSYQ